MIIDFRVRPPFGSFARSFGIPAGNDDAQLDAFVSVLLERGVSRAVIMGRTVSTEGSPSPSDMTNEDIIAMARRYPDFFIGFGSVNTTNRTNALAMIERLSDTGFKGIAFDNPLGSPPRVDDDQYLFPLYEAAAKRDLIISLTSSALVGPSISYVNPAALQAVAQAFPQTPVVVPHASWPRSNQAVGAVLQSIVTGSSQLYLIPDVYLHTGAPGSRDYEDALRWAEPANWTPASKPLNTRFLYASSSPVQAPDVALDAFIEMNISSEIKRAVLHDNAVRVLRL